MKGRKRSIQNEDDLLTLKRFTVPIVL